MTTGSVRQSSCDPEREEKRMFARVASFEGRDVERLRRLNEEGVNDGTMELPEGLRSAMMLQDHESGRRLFVTSSTAGRPSTRPSSASRRWETRSEDIRGRRTSLDVYEVVWQRDA